MDAAAVSGRNPVRISELTRDRTAEPASRDQILTSGANGDREKKYVSCSPNHEKDCIGNHTGLIHTLLKVMTIRALIQPIRLIGNTKLL